ncbi:MAG: hypothetical protein ACOX0O_12660 [Candidatus Methanoculleus thermohydrogenotrophicum]
MNFVDENGKRVGTVSLQSPSITAFEANAAEVYGNTTLAAAMGGEPVRDFGRETYYAQLKCHDPSGDDYYVTFTRKTVRISSYQDDAIKNKIERLRQTRSPRWSEEGAFTPCSFPLRRPRSRIPPRPAPL